MTGTSLLRTRAEVKEGSASSSGRGQEPIVWCSGSRKMGTLLPEPMSSRAAGSEGQMEAMNLPAAAPGEQPQRGEDTSHQSPAAAKERPP